MTDEQLAVACQGGDKAAWEELYKRYKPRVLKIARRFFLVGGETEDLVQEGMFGLISAVNGFKNGVSSFEAYAASCVKNRIVDTVKKSCGAKYSALNNFLPILEVAEEWVSPETPEDELIMREDKSELLSNMKTILSALEYKAVVKYTEGMTLTEISAALGKSTKSVDNAINRAKHKLLTFITEK